MKGKTVEPVQAPAVAVNEQEGPVVVKLTIPAELYAEYKDLADRQDLTPAELMVHRLQRCKSHASIRSLYFTTSQLSHLESLLQKRPIETSEQAMALLTVALSVRIGEFDPIPLTAQQVKRIHLSAYGGQTASDRLKMIVQNAISKAVGI